MLPKIDPVEGKVRKSKIFYSNEDGEIFIKKHYIFVDIYEWLSKEKISINLGVENDTVQEMGVSEEEVFLKYFEIHEYDEDYVKKIIRANEDYWGFVIYSSYGSDVSDKDTERSKFNILWNSKGLQKDSEEFLIELKRWDEAEDKENNI